ncbi:DNA-binding SARP family transcriptional activator [Amycolatopsis sulphurea]|uniref:DNA-binding SARP family transcriptional activator n=1 Tax=Amycolatopsis sulphurea TaxID=76022 RepID=A0A2A9F798_9PSEU|nr:BTAD domain-containing putative transcriptional regulator [Amycolatopsis sulphurea]PFG46402.1 DNA-binding SARP family transcriptional activator [Amycolatopsis sulphurea]
MSSTESCQIDTPVPATPSGSGELGFPATHAPTVIRLSGSVEVVRGGTVRPIRPGALRAVFVALVLENGRYVCRQRLLDLLWDKCPRSAPVNLRGCISRLRHDLAAIDPVLGASLVTLKGAGCHYALQIPDAAVDVRHFQHHAERGDQQRRAGDRWGAARHFHAALSAWCGPLGPGCAGSSRLDALFETYHERCLTVRERYAESLLQLGHTLELVPGLRDLLRSAPLREGAWCLLLRVTYLGGDLDATMGAWHEAVATLADHGLNPSAEMVRLHLAILRRDDAAIRNPYHIPGSRAPR